MSQGRPENEGALRVAVVGVGYWGPNLVRVLYEIPDEAEVAWVCDLDSKRLEAIGRRYPALRTTSSYQEVIADADVDAVVIATPASTHYPLARAALSAGKHVFVEKPLATSSRHVADLVELAEDRGLLLMPGHTFLYSAPVNAVRELIRSGELGDIYFVSTSRVNLGLHQPDVSVTWDLGPHDFSILRYWFEESPVRVSGMSRSCVIPAGVPDVTFVNLEFPSGAIAHVELSWLAPSKLRRTTIVGSRKMVVYDDTSNEPVRIFDSGVMPEEPKTYGEFQLSYRSGDIVSPRLDAGEPLALELLDFCSSVRLGDQPRSSLELGSEVVRICEGVDASLARKGHPVELAPGRVGARAARRRV